MKELLLLTQSLTLTNLDVLSVGVTISAITLLGFIVYMSNPRSITNTSFLFFCVVTIFWSFFNYISYQTSQPGPMLLLLRLVIFLSFWHAFSFFNFLYVFPKDKVVFPKWYRQLLVPFILVMSSWALMGDLVFSDVILSDGVLVPVVEKGIVLFAVIAFSLAFSGAVLSIVRVIKAKTEDKKSQLLILIGVFFTLLLLLTFNLILPVVFDITHFTSFGAVTIFPFSVFTAYAIFKHKTFKVRNLGSTLMAFLLCVVMFIEIVFVKSKGELILRSGIFLFVLLISIQFVKNIFRLESTTKKLEEANSQLQSLDKLKSEFISLASHQLRSPLTVIKGYASTLTDGVVGDLSPKQAEIVRHIYASAQGLASVVEDFLNVTKIEQGGMQYLFEATDVRHIVDDLVSDMKLVTEDRHLSFSSFVEAKGLYMVNADATKLRQVFLNIIDNSIKYTKEGFVKVSLTKDENLQVIIFSVQDSGVGLDEETKKKLFTKFGRGDGGHINGGGSGLGLYLANEIVKAHHGSIEVISEGAGKGATFSVVLPSI